MNSLEKKFPDIRETNYKKIVIHQCLAEKYSDRERRRTTRLTGVEEYLRDHLFKDFPQARGRGIGPKEIEDYRRSITGYWKTNKHTDPDLMRWYQKMPQLFDSKKIRSIETLFDVPPTQLNNELDKELNTDCGDYKTELVKVLGKMGVKSYKDTQYGMEIQF